MLRTGPTFSQPKKDTPLGPRMQAEGSFWPSATGMDGTYHFSNELWHFGEPCPDP